MVSEYHRAIPKKNWRIKIKLPPMYGILDTRLWTNQHLRINITGWIISAVTADRPLGASGFHSLKGS